jgi:hypothetical protein
MDPRVGERGGFSKSERDKVSDLPCDTEPLPATPYRAMITAQVQIVITDADVSIEVKTHRFGESVPLRSIDVAHAGVELRVALEKYTKPPAFKVLK